MPRNASTGVYAAPASSVNPAVDNTAISAADFNALRDDLATALAHQASTTRALYPTTGQVQDGGFAWAGTAAGTANAVAITVAPAITALAAGQVFRFVTGPSANTGAVTLSVSGLAAAALNKGTDGTTALAAGDLPANALVTAAYDGTNFRLLDATMDGATARSVIGAAPLPTGVIWSAISVGAPNSYSLPAGGTWAWMAVQYSSGLFNTCLAGVSAGGTPILTGGAGISFSGIAWKIA